MSKCRVKVGAALCEPETGTAPAAAAPPAPAAAASLPTPAARGSALQTFKVADIGEGIAQVQLTEAFIKEGDMVKEMDNLFSVESDKASVEMTSPYTGKVKKVHFKVNDTVQVGAGLVDIEVAGAAPAAAAAPAAPLEVPVAAGAAPAVSAPKAGTTAGSGKKAPGVLATPKTRALAKKEGVDLNVVTGTGPKGKVLATDVMAHLEGGAATSLPAAAAPGPAKSAPARPTAKPGEDVVVEIKDNVGKGMVKSMAASLNTPYMALGEELDVTEIIALQKALKKGSLAKYGTRPTITTIILKAISLALAEHPILNSKFGPADANPPRYTMYGNHNICVAIDSPHGLVVPNIKDVGGVSLIDVQREMLRLAEGAQKGKLACKS